MSGGKGECVVRVGVVHVCVVHVCVGVWGCGDRGNVL